VTAGGLVFTGTLTGEFIAVDADTGKTLWQFQTPSGIIGQPVTWERNGKQYVTITSGIGGVLRAQNTRSKSSPMFRREAVCGPLSYSRTERNTATRRRPEQTPK